MKFIGDFHIHSKYSRAVSPEMTLENLDKWAGVKGIKVMGTGDFTHPKWFKEIKEKLEPAEPGLFKLKEQYKVKDFQIRYNPSAGPDGNVGASGNGTRFLLTAEISSIYSKAGKVRRIHNLVFLPSIEAVEKFNAHLGLRGNLASDGRPIVGVDSKDILKLAYAASSEALIIPSHCWTPWFSIFGSKSGFDSIEECFDEYSKYIYALETGLSSDPQMNWRLSKLDNITLISNSDSHSLTRIGREANVFEAQLSYQGIAEAIKFRKLASAQKGTNRLLYTIEFFPEEGKYHYDGHRGCNVCFNPAESKKNNFICPVCSKPLTLGVLYRVDELADRQNGLKPLAAADFKNMVPLDQIIGDALDMGANSKSVWSEYKKLIEKFGNEFLILFELNEDELKNSTAPAIAEGIIRVRNNKLEIKPGYDGEYGVVKIFSQGERENFTKQATLL